MSSEDFQIVDESIVGTIKDGQTIVRSVERYVVRGPLLQWYCEIGFQRLNTISAILDINIQKTIPKASIYGITDKTITRHATGGYPVLGFTVTNIPAGITHTGTTMSVEAVCIGW